MNEDSLKQRANIAKPTTISLTRKDEKEKLKNEQATTLQIFFLSLLKKLHYEKGNIDYTSYIYFLILLQLRLHYVSKMFNLIMIFGAKAFLIIHTIFILAFGLPVFMLLVFMARYCRKGYFGFWHCVPVLQGMGYTYALWVTACELINITLSGLSLVYIQHTIVYNIPWSSCSFANTTNLCVNSKKEIDSNQSSCSTFPALEYFRAVIQRQQPGTLGLGIINGNLALAVFLLWLVLLYLMVGGFTSFQSKMKKVQTFVFFIWLFTFLVTVNHSQHYRSPLNEIHSPWNMKFFLKVLLFVLSQNSVCDLIWIASINFSSSLPTSDAIIVYSFKLIALSAFTVWVPVLLKIILYEYKNIEITCLALSGFDIIFAVIPDIISRYPFSRLTSTLWFLGILLHGFLSALYMLTATVDSLGDAFPKLYQYRGHACVLICVFCALFNLLYVTRSGVILMQTWIEYGNIIVSDITISITILSLIFIYSIQRLVNDYQFAFGLPPFKLWIELWKIIPFITLFQTVLTVYDYTVGINVVSTNTVFIKWTTVTAVLMLLPIFIGMLFKYLTLLKYHMVSSIIRADADWGYYIESKKKERDLFNPQTEVRYKRNQLKCSHNCLVNSENLKKLQELNDLHVQYILEEMSSKVALS